MAFFSSKNSIEIHLSVHRHRFRNMSVLNLDLNCKKKNSVLIVTPQGRKTFQSYLWKPERHAECTWFSTECFCYQQQTISIDTRPTWITFPVIYCDQNSQSVRHPEVGCDIEQEFRFILLASSYNICLQIYSFGISDWDVCFEYYVRLEDYFAINDLYLWSVNSPFFVWQSTLLSHTHTHTHTHTHHRRYNKLYRLCTHIHTHARAPPGRYGHTLSIGSCGFF